jgi:competence/damage-inducible protein CinA-like protein
LNAEIVTIGTELLLGETLDTNSAHIARALREIGLDLYYQTTVGDNKERAAAVITAALDRAEVVITTGGLGPTEDDVTREAVAIATGRELEFRPDLFAQIEARYRRWGSRMAPTNRQQAFVPGGALGLENPVGTAPCFILETTRGVVISLPGVPQEMERMLQDRVLPYLQSKLSSPAVILSQILRTAGIGESQIDAAIRDLEQGSNPTVGLSAHAGQTDIRITAKAPSLQEAETMIEPLAQEIRKRLGTHIYGQDRETVEEVLVGILRDHDLSLATAEAGTGGLAGERLQQIAFMSEIVQQSVYAADWSNLAIALGFQQATEWAHLSLKDRAQRAAERVRARTGSHVGLGILIEPESEGSLSLAVGIASDDQASGWVRGYGGPPGYVERWATTYGFDQLRRWLLRTDSTD